MPQPTQVTRSRLPILAIAVWAAILAAIVAVSVVFGGQGNVSGTDTLGAAGANLVAPLAAAPSASPSAGASTAPGKDNDGTRKGPGGFIFGRGGPGGFGPAGGGPGRGPVSISAINGSQLSLKTDDGWARTIDATGATVTERGGAALTVADLKVGDQVQFRQTRNADGTYKITEIVRIPLQTGGTVKGVDASSAVLTLKDGTTKTIGLTATTTYFLNGKAATIADLAVGTRVHAVGTADANGAFTATRVEIAPATVAGTVTATSAGSITIKDPSGASSTITVDSATTYQTRGKTAATLADVSVGDIVIAQGTLNSDGSLKATSIRIGGAVMGGPGKGGHGGRTGGAHPGKPGNPNASPAPSANAG